MKCTITPEERIDYIYDELDAEARLRMEKHIATCAECRADIAGLQDLQTKLPHHEAPPMPGILRLPSAEPVKATVTPLLQTTWFRALASTAAAMLIIIFGAQFAGLNIRVDDGATTIRFGEPVATVPNPEQIETAPDLQQLFAEFRAEQQQFVNSLSDSIKLAQQKQFDQTLVAFGRYLDERRDEDLVLIATNLEEMQRLNDNRFIETQFVISQLINQMNQDLNTITRR